MMEFYKDPTFLIGIIGAVAASIGTWWIRSTKLQEQRHYLDQQYTKEVDDIKRIILSWGNSFGGFAEFVGAQPNRTKEIFQHIYTFDRSLFDKLKQSIHIQNESLGKHQPAREEVYFQFWESIKNKIYGMSTSRPEFGYCNGCKNWLTKKQRSKYSNVDDVENNFGDCSKW